MKGLPRNYRRRDDAEPYHPEVHIVNFTAWGEVPERFQNAVRQNWNNPDRLAEVLERLSSGMEQYVRRKIFKLIARSLFTETSLERKTISRKPDYEYRK